MTIMSQSDVMLTTPSYSSPDYCWHEMVLINKFDLVTQDTSLKRTRHHINTGKGPFSALSGDYLQLSL